MNPQEFDLNADLGEGFGVWRLGDDDALLDIVTSANIACGFHAGDPAIMRRCAAAAVRAGVSIGAQVSYRDFPGFGRRPMEVPPDELTAEVLYQLSALDGIARTEGGRVRYVKPHGALYTRIAHDREQAAAVVAAVAAYPATDDHGRLTRLPLLTLPRSVAREVAGRAGVATISECFPDRAYTPDGALLPRRQNGAVLDDPQEVGARAARMATEGRVRAADGTDTDAAAGARSACVHGDSPGAVALARSVRGAVLEAGARIGPFA